MKPLFLLVILMFLTSIGFAQVPNSFNYQAVVRSASGEIIAEQNVTFKISILQNSETGTAVYVETHQTMTNKFGLANLKIGKGTVVSGTFSPTGWGSAKHFVKVELDPNGGSSFSHLGTSESSSVPYAFHAQTVENGDNWGVQSVVVNSTLSGNGTIERPLGVEGNLTDNQTLSLSGNDLSILRGNTVTLPSANASPWQKSDSNIFYNSGKVSIGSANPNSNGVFTIHGKEKSSFAYFTNDATGNTVGDGLLIGHDGGASYLWNYENSPIYFATDGTPRVFISNDGKVGIGTTQPNYNAILTVNGKDKSGFAYFTNNATGNTAGDGLLIGHDGGASYLWNYENSPIYFATNGSPRVFISNDGKVGIGTTNPSYRLDVTGLINLNKTTPIGIALLCNGKEAIWHNGTFYSWGFGLDYNYFAKPVTIGTNATPAYMLVVNGTAAKTGGGSWSNLSDARLKNISGNYQKGLSEITKLQPIKFTYKEGNPRELSSDTEQIGFVAQEVQKIFPEAVSEAEDGYLDFNIHSINVAMVNAIKELKFQNGELAKQVDNLKSRLDELEAFVKATTVK